MEDNLYVMVSDLLHAAFNSTDLCISSTRGNQILDTFITYNPELFLLKLRSSMAVNDHCLFQLRLKTYCRSAFH